MCRELAREALQGFRVRSTEDPGKIVGCGGESGYDFGRHSFVKIWVVV